MKTMIRLLDDDGFLVDGESMMTKEYVCLYCGEHNPMEQALYAQYPYADVLNPGPNQGRLPEDCDPKLALISALSAAAVILAFLGGMALLSYIRGC